MYEIVINPASKSGKGARLWCVVKEILDKKKIEYNEHISTAAGDVKNILERITADGKHHEVIILGGDGTFNEALQGVSDFAKVTFGYIPTGSSNDLARDLNISTDPSQAIENIINACEPMVFDIGKLTYSDGEQRLYAVGCGVGFDAAVCAEAMNSKIKDVFNRIGLGKLTYLGIALKEILQSGKGSIKLELFDEEENATNTFEYSQMIFNAAMVHRYEGGGFMFCPEATGHDGLLHLCTAASIKPAKIIKIMPSAFKGKHVGNTGIYMNSCKKLKVTLSEPLWVHTDGEAKRKADQFTVECVPSQLRLYV